MSKQQDFFNSIRPCFPGGKLTTKQVAGTKALLEECTALPHHHTAYVLATAAHETGFRMQPVREGFASSDEQAARIITSMFNRGRITRNYSKKHPATNQRYFGRGYVQLTWYENYSKTGIALDLDLVNNPGLMLDPEISAKAIVWGMQTGAYRRNKSLNSEIKTGTRNEFIRARDMINGDVSKNGPLVAGYAKFFLNALKG